MYLTSIESIFAFYEISKYRLDKINRLNIKEKQSLKYISTRNNIIHIIYSHAQ